MNYEYYEPCASSRIKSKHWYIWKQIECLGLQGSSLGLYLRRYKQFSLENQCSALTKILTQVSNIHSEKYLISHVLIVNDYKL